MDIKISRGCKQFEAARDRDRSGIKLAAGLGDREVAEGASAQHSVAGRVHPTIAAEAVGDRDRAAAGEAAFETAGCGQGKVLDGRRAIDADIARCREGLQVGRSRDGQVAVPSHGHRATQGGGGRWVDQVQPTAVGDRQVRTGDGVQRGDALGPAREGDRGAEHEVLHSIAAPGEAVAGPVRGIGPEAGASAAIPAEAIAALV